MDNYLGEIRMFIGPYAPQDWAFCNGQALSISNNTALYSLIGTTYGGNGSSTFNLPDLRGRVPVHVGTGINLPPINLAQAGGTEETQLVESNLPAHTHALQATTDAANTNIPTNAIFANTGTGDNEYIADSNINAIMYPGIVGTEGGQTPIDNLQPFFTVSFIIALKGNFPPRP